MKLFIVVEGVDGVGKTALSQKLCSYLNAKYLKTPLRVLKPLESIFVGKNREFETIGFLFLAVLTGIYIRMFRIFKPIVCDKYILTTIIDQLELGSWVAKFLMPLRYWLVPKPDCTLTLLVDSEEDLILRLTSKGWDENDVEMFPHWQRLQAIYQSLPETKTINASDLDERATFEYALVLLEG